MRFFFILMGFFFLVTAQAGSFKEDQFDPVLQKATDSSSLKIFLAAGLTTAFVQPQDDQIRSDWKSHQKMTESQAHLGDLLGSGMGGVLLLGTQYLWDDNRNHYQSHARALVYSTVVNSALKTIFYRPRPNEKDRYSFPSGHTMTAFTTATSLTYAYGWKAAAITYPIAIFIGLSRLSDDAHWGSDVVAGAFVGIFMARACFYNLDENKELEVSSNNFIIYPVIQPGMNGLSLVHTF